MKRLDLYTVVHCKGYVSTAAEYISDTIRMIKQGGENALYHRY